MKDFLKENWFKLVIAFVILLIGATFFYAYTLRPILNKPKLERCLTAAQDKREERWRSYCRIDNRQIGTDGSCLNTKERADYVNGLLDKDKADCFKQYPQN